MSNFSDFFAAAGGGGGIGKTVTVGDYSYPNAIKPDVDKINKYQNHQGTTNYFNTQITGASYASHPEVYVVSNNMSSYETVVDITSSDNGGALYTCYIASTDTSYANYQYKIKVTIDGTAYEYTFYQDNRRHMTCVLGIGAFYQNYRQNSTAGGRAHPINICGPTPPMSGYGDLSRYTPTLNSAGGTSSDTQITNRGNFNSTAGTTANQMGPMTPGTFVGSGVPYLHFESTLKVETFTGRDSTGDYGTAFVHLF